MGPTMLYLWLANLVVLLHFGFVVFVAAGGFAVLRWRRLAWLHLPVALWGALIEFTGWVCPLTPLENHLRHRAGDAGYAGGFIEHYITPVVYPAGLTRGAQIVLGLLVVAINASVYARLYVSWRRRRRAGGLPGGGAHSNGGVP
jgi:hypothetical protein